MAMLHHAQLQCTNYTLIRCRLEEHQPGFDCSLQWHSLHAVCMRFVHTSNCILFEIAYAYIFVRMIAADSRLGGFVCRSCMLLSLGTYLVQHDMSY